MLLNLAIRSVTLTAGMLCQLDAGGGRNKIAARQHSAQETPPALPLASREKKKGLGHGKELTSQSIALGLTLSDLRDPRHMKEHGPWPGRFLAGWFRLVHPANTI